MTPGTSKLLEIGAPIVLGVAGLVLLMKHGSSSTSTTSSATPSSAGGIDGTTAAVGALAAYESATEQQIATLRASLGGEKSTPTSGTAPTTGPVQRGGSLDAVRTTGPTDVGIATWAEATALMKEGTTIYWEPSPGVFKPAAKTGHLVIPPGTTTSLFLQRASGQ